MDIDAPTPWLGGLSPQQFMRRHWQRRPLLVRAAAPGIAPPLDRAGLFALAARDDVRSRLVVREGRGWSLRHGPIPRRALPPLTQRRWTLLVQGVDARVDAAHELLAHFRFVGDVRLDDLMISWASDGGGVGPHVDSYDVFLLQVQGRRRWRVGRVADASLVPGLPLKILRRFVAEEEWLLGPGDMLYLPPGWGHDGVAVGECMTCSIGFRAPGRGEAARALLERLADTAGEPDPRRFLDRREVATGTPARVPGALAAFARAALERALRDEDAFDAALGEWLSEPDPLARFEPGRLAVDGVVLDRATRMVYDDRHVFVNGEAWRVAGRDATLLRRLADRRRLGPRELRGLSPQASERLREWIDDGWAHGSGSEE